MGGSDDETNLVEVSITQHAMYHFCNYQLWGNTEDYVAWRGLSGTITEQEFLLEKFREFGKKGSQKFRTKLKEDSKFAEEFSKKMKEIHKNPEYRNRNLELLEKYQPIAIIAALNPEAIKKKKESLKRIKHQQGEKNSQYGKMWITNGTKEGTYRIDKNEPIPEGFRKGRISKDDNFMNCIYAITTPNGDIIKTKYLVDYCNKNDLQNTHMYAVLKGKRKHHKGYKVYKEELISSPPPQLSQNP